jgi:putative membrane protein
MLLSGLALLLWSGQPSAFYLRNPVFYIKLAIFVAMILIAITPARLVVQWHREAALGTLPEPDAILFVKRYFTAEAILFLLVPLAASISAQGICLHSSPSSPAPCRIARAWLLCPLIGCAAPPLHRNG